MMIVIWILFLKNSKTSKTVGYESYFLTCFLFYNISPKLPPYVVMACLHCTYTCNEVLFMIKSSTIFLFISFIFLFFNGSAISFIFFQVRLGEAFGIALFCGTSLFGALLASIAYEKNSSYYSRLFFYSNLVVTFLPFYYYGVSNLLS